MKNDNFGLLNASAKSNKHDGSVEAVVFYGAEAMNTFVDEFNGQIEASAEDAENAERELHLEAIQRDALLLQASLLRLKIAKF